MIARSLRERDENHPNHISPRVFRLAPRLGIDYSPPILPAIAHGRTWVDEPAAGTIGIWASEKRRVFTMIQKHPILRLLSLGLLLSTAGLVGCNGLPIPIDDIIDLIDNSNDNGNANANDNGNGGQTAPRVSFQTYATNTGGASGMALHPGTGELYAVNRDGLFGPISEGDDLSTMTPIGATNLGDDNLFDTTPESLTLAITNEGEFWITSLQTTVAVVPPEGGDAEPYLGLFDPGVPELTPETTVLVPDGFEGPEIKPGHLLIGGETTFSRLFQVDVAGDRSVLVIAPTEGINRQAHHLAFGLDGALYSSKGVAAITQPGLQTIDTDGTPTNIDSSLGIAADTFIVLANGDMVIRGTWQMTATNSSRGILLFDAAAGEFSLGLSLTSAELSESDEMVISSDGLTILLSRPAVDEIVRISIADE